MVNAFTMNPAALFPASAKLATASLCMVFFSSHHYHDIPINYLGQKPPGMQAEIFAPGIISSPLSEHSSPAFSPDRKTVLWTVMNQSYRGSIWEMKYQNGKWTKPARPAFADSTADDYYPSFSADGSQVYFSSRRKLPAGYPEDRDICIWQVDRTRGGWGKPMPFDTLASQGQDYAHSVSAKGNIYLSSAKSGGSNLNLKSAALMNGRYSSPVLLPYNINSLGYEDGPFIAPDESFLIFESQRPDGIGGSLDLYISFKSKNGQWSLPMNMGPKINSAHGERFARLSPDGKYLFFGSGRNMSEESWGFDIFWIDAGIIADLKKDPAAQTLIDESMGQLLIEALHQDDIKKSSALLKDWVRKYPHGVDAFVLYTSMLRKEQRYADANKLMEGMPPGWANNVYVISERALVNFGLHRDEEANALLLPILGQGDQQRDRLLYLSASLLDMRRLDISDIYFDKAMQLGAGSFPYYQRACALARIGEKDRAFTALEKAVDLGGFNVRKEYENEDAFHSLHADERWAKLLEKLK